MLLCTTVSLTTLQYWSSADAGVSTYFTGAGNVGIGVVPTTAKLTLSGTIDSMIRLNKSSGTTYNYIEWLSG